MSIRTLIERPFIEMSITKRDSDILDEKTLEMLKSAQTAAENAADANHMILSLIADLCFASTHTEEITVDNCIISLALNTLHDVFVGTDYVRKDCEHYLISHYKALAEAKRSKASRA